MARKIYFRLMSENITVFPVSVAGTGERLSNFVPVADISQSSTTASRMTCAEEGVTMQTEKAEPRQVDALVMPFQMDWRKCDCGWAGTPVETKPESKRLYNEDGSDWRSIVEQLCPKCNAATFYDGERRKAPGHLSYVELQLSTKNMILAKLRLRLVQFDRTPEVMDIKHYLDELMSA